MTFYRELVTNGQENTVPLPKDTTPPSHTFYSKSNKYTVDYQNVIKVLPTSIPAAYREIKCMERWTLIDLNGAHYKLVLFDV